MQSVGKERNGGGGEKNAAKERRAYNGVADGRGEERRARPAKDAFYRSDAFYSPQDRWRGSEETATMRNPVQLNAYCSHIFESIQPLSPGCIGAGCKSSPR